MKKIIFKLYLIILLTLVSLIILKSNKNIRDLMYRYIYTENFSFAILNNWYNSNFGNPLPFSDFFEESTPVFNESLKYKSANKYKDGVALNVGIDYLVPSLDNGIVIFIGNKDDYGQTVIVQQENGVDVWYSNINEVNVKLYDYIGKGSLIGSANEIIYLIFIKNGEVIDYEEYI